MIRKNHVERPTNKEVANRKKKKIIKYFVLTIIFMLLVGGIFLYVNKENIDFNSLMGNSSKNNYKLMIDKVQTNFYKNGTFTTKGLYIKKGNSVYNPKLKSAPNLNNIGRQKVVVEYNNKEFSYFINVFDNHPGDIITLIDGSKWYFLENSDGYTKLLSMYYLTEVCSSNNDCYLDFLDKNKLDTEVEGKEAPYEKVYKTKYNSKDAKLGYEDSNIKNILDIKFTEKFKTKLNKNNVSSKIIENIDITLPDANIISRISNVKDFDVNSKKSYSLDETSLFLLGGKTTYWLQTKLSDDSSFAWVVNSSSKLNYGATTSFEFAIRPQITISDDNLKNIVIKIDNNSDGSLDNVTAPNYYIYDVTNSVVVREHKSLETTGNLDTIYPASMTKVATLVVTLDLLKEKKINLDTEVTIHDCISITKDYYKKINYTPSYSDLNSGDVVTYRDLLYGVMFKSGWESTMQLAISLTGNKDKKGTDYDSCKSNVLDVAEKTYSDMMNKKTKEIVGDGSVSNFKNVSGLIHKEQVSSMHDIAMLMNYAMKNEEFRKIESSSKYETKNGLIYYHPSSSTLKKLDYFKASKNGHAKSNGINSLYNEVIYLASENKEYVVVVASVNSSENRLSDLFSIYQWLFPGNVGGKIYKEDNENLYTLTFNSNGGSNTMDAQIFTYNIAQKISKNIFKKEGYTFNGWNTKKDGSGTFYEDEQEIKLSANKTIYAQWKEKYSYIINKYSYDSVNKYINKIDINTTIDSFKKNIKLDEGYSIEVDYKNIDGKKLLYTGSKTKIYKDNNLVDEYTNIIRGEVTGDGKINYLDYVSVYNHIQKVKHPELNKKELTNEYLISADISEDGKINYLDYVKIYNRIKELKGGD